MHIPDPTPEERAGMTNAERKKANEQLLRGLGIEPNGERPSRALRRARRAAIRRDAALDAPVDSTD